MIEQTNDVEKSKYKHLTKLLYCSFFCMCCYSLQIAGKNITYNIYNQAGLTFIYPMQSAINHFIAPFAVIFVDAIISRFRMGFIIYLGSFNAFSFLLGSLMVTSCTDNDYFYCNSYFLTIVIGIETLFGGIASCIFYVSYPIYINSLTNEKNKSLYQGIAYSMLSLCQIIGNVTGYFLSNKISIFHYYLYLVLGLLIVQVFLLFIIDVRPKMEKKTIKLGQILKLQISQLQTAFQYKRFQYLVPYTLFSAMIQGCYFNVLPVLMKGVLGKTNNQNTFKLFLFGGLGSLLGGFISGNMGQSTSLFNVGWYQTFNATLFCVESFIAYNYKNLYLAYVSGTTLGLTYSGIEALHAMMIAKLINKENYYFAANNAVINFGSALISVVFIFISKYTFMYYFYFIVLLIVLNIIWLAYAQIKVNKQLRSVNLINTEGDESEKIK